VAKLADAPDLGSGGAILRGSSPLPGISARVPNAALPDDKKEPYDWGCDLVADTKRIRQGLGYQEVVSPETAIRRTIACERANVAPKS
jgi:nucleoside-diphosphate-sugar epimerase